MAEVSSRALFAHYRHGDSRAAAEIFDRYVRRLVELTRQRISPKLARRIDPEDVVQSAYRSFFIRARNGSLVLERSGDLWRLLCGITLNKLHGQVERHTAQRRSIGREAAPDRELTAIAQAPEPTPDEVAGMNEQLQLTMQRLSKAQRQMLEMRLQGHTIEEIAVASNRSQRTARRTLASIEQTLKDQLAVSQLDP